MPQCTRISLLAGKWLGVCCRRAWLNHRQSGPYGVSSWAAAPLPTAVQRHSIRCHTRSLRALFSCLVYKLEQLRFIATSYRPALPWEARSRPVTLWMGHYELETWAGPAQFLWLSISTHPREKQLYYKLVRSVTLTNVLQKPGSSRAQMFLPTFPP